MNSYKIYGLRISSAIPLPGVDFSGEGRRDVVIKLGKVDIEPPPSERKDIPYSVYYLSDHELYFSWDGVANYHLREGRMVTVEPNQGVEKWRVGLPILGLALPLLLFQRGFLALHGSAIEINGIAIALLGGKGWGKSTLASSFYERGHNLIDDDVVALDVSAPKEPTVYPGFPQFKLWPDAIAKLGLSPERLTRFHPEYEKCIYRVNNGFSSKSRVLRKIYVLSQGPDLEIIAIQAKEAMVQLIGNSYVARLATRFVNGVVESTLLEQCARVARSVPIYWLKRPNSLKLLPHLAQSIEEHVDHDLH